MRSLVPDPLRAAAQSRRPKPAQFPRGVFMILITVLLTAPLGAATHVITVVTDSVDAAPGDGACADVMGECSLRAAVMESNASAGADEISLGELTYEITIPECGEGTTVAYDDACGDLDVTDALTLRGVGAYRSMITADGLTGLGNGGHFDVSAGGSLTLEDLMLRDGGTLGSGGAIRNNGGQLVIRNSVLYGNTASFSGGAIDTRDGSALIEGTLILGNQAQTASVGGGGIYHGNSTAPAGTTLTVINSSLVANTAAGGTGGTAHDDANGGGISLGAQAVAELVQVTFAQNQATARGGGLHLSGDAGSAILRGCTFSENRADSDGDTDLASTGNGGGLANIGNATVELYNTLIADNRDPAPVANVQRPDCLGHLSVISHTLIEDFDCTADTTTNTLSGDPALLPVGDRGGSMQTVGFDLASPARDAADGSLCPMADARGELRFQNGACDIGAWESGYDPRFVVKSSLDLPDQNPGDSLCSADFLPALGICTLRAAVEETSELAAEDPVTAQIRLGAFPYPVMGTTGPLEVWGLLSLKIEGSGARSTLIEGDGGDRVFDVDRFSDGAVLTLRNLTVRGGETDGIGGNIQVRGQGSFNGDRIAIENGTANRGGGLGVHDIASATLIDSTVSGNSTPADQGGGGEGAGIYAAGQNLDLANVTVSGNDAEGSGGGVAVFSGLFSFDSVTLTNNSADADGDDEGDGGGFFAAEEEQGVVRNSLIAGNTDVGGGEAPDCAGLVDSVGYNLIGITDNSCGFGSTGDQTGSAAFPLVAGIGPLSDNGGGTDTHAPLGGSPVIDFGDPVNCLPTDQRGLLRPFDGDGNGDARCDIGAVESGEVIIFSDGFETGNTSRWAGVQP